jgi:hypothetical protein
VLDSGHRPGPLRERSIDRAGELIERVRLDQGGGEHDPELGELRWGRGDAGADDRQHWIDGARNLREHRAGGRRGLDHQHIRALQLLRSGHPDEDRLVAEAGDHLREQMPDLLVGLADQYSCHTSSIGDVRLIQGRPVV